MLRSSFPEGYRAGFVGAVLPAPSMPMAVLPVRRRFRSTAKLGKSCGCRAIAIGRTAWSVISFFAHPRLSQRFWLRPCLNRRQRFANDGGLETPQPLIDRNQFDDRAP